MSKPPESISVRRFSLNSQLWHGVPLPRAASSAQPEVYFIDPTLYRLLTQPNTTVSRSWVNPSWIYRLPVQSKRLVRQAFSLGLLSMLLGQTTAFALPTGYQAVEGQVQFQQPDSQTLNITSNSASAIINYQSFNILQGETVNFFLPGETASILNRVIGGGSSEILGALHANGNVFLSNPNGVMFGQMAQVNVGALFVSTLGISNQDFMAGNYTFRQDPTHAPGAIVNQGTITAKPGGSITLAAGAIQNSGTLSAPQGKVNLAVGDKVTMVVEQGIMVDVTVDEAIKDKVVGYQDAIENTGTLQATGGAVKLQAELANHFYEHAVNNTGIIEAQGFENHNGTVEVVAHASTQDALVQNSGMVNVSGNATGPNGGKILLEGDKVQQDGTVLAEAGEHGSGGQINITSTQGTALTAGSLTSARGAGDESNAGTIHIWSDTDTHFDKGAILDVSGGHLSGNGGFVEVSAKNTVHFEGQAKGDAVNGKGGQILIDPTNVRIVAADPHNGSTNIALGDADNGAGESTFQASTFSGFSDVNIEASNDITIETPFSLANITAGHNLTIKAGNDLTIQDALSTNGGNINLYADADLRASGGADSDGNGILNILNTGSVTSNNGNVLLQGSQIKIDGPLDAGNGSVVIRESVDKQVNVGEFNADNDTALLLDISTPELNLITAHDVTIGSNTLGYDFTVDDILDLNGVGPGKYDLNLVNVGDMYVYGYNNNLGTHAFNLTAGGNIYYDIINNFLGAKNIVVSNVTAQDIFLTTRGAGGFFGSTPSSITVNGNVTARRNLSIQSDNNVTVTGNVTSQGLGTSQIDLISAGTFDVGGQLDIPTNKPAENFTFQVGGGTILNQSFFNSNWNFHDISFTLLGNNTPVTLGGSLTAGQYVYLESYGTDSPITLTGPVSAGLDLYVTGNALNTYLTKTSGTLQLSANNDININGTILTSGIPIELKADADGNGAGSFFSTDTITSTNADITLQGAFMDIQQAVNAGPQGTIFLKPSTPGSTITLGGGVGDFDISDAEFDNLTAGTVVVGSPTATGALDIGAVDLSAQAYDLILKTTGAITDGTVADDTTPNLILGNNQSLTLTGGLGTGTGQIGVSGLEDLDITLAGTGILSVLTNNADIFINSTTDMRLGLISTGSGQINLETTNGSILDGNGSQDNLYSSANASLIAGGGVGSTIGTGSDALDARISGGTLTVQASGALNGVSVNIFGLVIPGHGLIQAGGFTGSVFYTEPPAVSTIATTASQAVPYLLNPHITTSGTSNLTSPSTIEPPQTEIEVDGLLGETDNSDIPVSYNGPPPQEPLSIEKKDDAVELRKIRNRP